jgi:hypothetical protein
MCGGKRLIRKQAPVLKRSIYFQSAGSVLIEKLDWDRQKYTDF